MPESLVNAVREWWDVGAFIVAGVLAFIVGKERQRWRVNQIGEEVEKQGKRISHLEAQGHTSAVTLAEIRTNQNLILTMLRELREDLKGKVDK